MIAEGDLRKQKGGASEVVNNVLSVISDYLHDVRFGKKYEGLLEVAEECPDAKFYQLDTFSETRFAAFTHKVLYGFLRDSPFIIVSLERRAMGSDKKSAEEAKRLLKRIANTSFLGNLAGLCDLYREIGSLCTSVQKVNLFLWERLDFVRSSLDRLEKMKIALRDTDSQDFKDSWPAANEFWPKLKSNTLIAGIPYLETDQIESYFTQRNSRQASGGGTSIFDTITSNLVEFIDSSVPIDKSRLLADEEEIQLADSVSTLTNMKKLQLVAIGHEKMNLWKR